MFKNSVHVELVAVFMIDMGDFSYVQGATILEENGYMDFKSNGYDRWIIRVPLEPEMNLTSEMDKLTKLIPPSKEALDT